MPGRLRRLTRDAGDAYDGHPAGDRPTANAPIVSIEDAYITGKLDLRGADLDFQYDALKQPIMLDDDAEVRRRMTHW